MTRSIRRQWQKMNKDKKKNAPVDKRTRSNDNGVIKTRSG